MLADHSINASLINPKSAAHLDVEALNDLKKDHELVVTLENNSLAGGFGEKVASFYGPSDMKVMTFGEKREYTDLESVASIYKRNHLTPDQISKDILDVLHQ